MLAQGLIKAMKGRLISTKSWEGLPLSESPEQEAAQDYPSIGPVLFSFNSPQQAPIGREPPQTPETSAPTQPRWKRLPPPKKSDKLHSATQGRQALSFDTNSRWVPPWTPCNLLHPQIETTESKLVGQVEWKNLTTTSDLSQPYIFIAKPQPYQT
ncbi:hypothetical protein M430DRAFT_220678 [Amorphotheca resinae ATCC 22711]|uniref:Uncharacterized protein n=1 Tax=Amorphotheca resinae ATCC 22711 TaxID=857342 RepID=A0A2T3B5N0_AMORE|nr:hypothetical protein M430DRAFT_220678 [Amorphotheca resinae ATCC 22711]PSS22065.1 hypothetical protein M430DRAFT_220678 [Amorphotheca resinae ATCC 22711]